MFLIVLIEMADNSFYLSVHIVRNISSLAE